MIHSILIAQGGLPKMLRCRSERRTFRHGWPPAFPFAIGSIFLALMGVVIVGFPGSLIARIGASCLLLPPAFVSFRIGSIGAHFSRSGLVLRRMFSTRRLGWDEVRAFIIAPRGIQRLAAFAVLESGERVWIEGVGPWMRFAEYSPGLDAIVREMNSALPRFREMSRSE
jgi:hypothetical protein